MSLRQETTTSGDLVTRPIVAVWLNLDKKKTWLVLERRKQGFGSNQFSFVANVT